MTTASGTSSASMHSQSSIDSEWGNESPPRISPSRKQITTPVRDALTRQVEQSTERRRRARRDKTVKASADSVTALYREESDQLVRDFNQILIRSNRDLTERLDLTVERHAKIHQDKLLQAAAEHDRVRQFAEREKLRVFLEEEQIRLKKEEQQQREIARLKQEKARQEEEARQRVLQQKLKEEEAARKAAEQAKQIRDAEARAKAEKEEALAAQKQKAEREEAERKAKEQAEKTKAQQAQVALPVTQAATVPIPVPSQSASSTQRSNAEREAVHQQYLDLHKRLKAYRDWMTTEGKKIPALKSLVGDSRRELRIKAGQITTDRNNSKATIFAIRQVLNKAKETGNLLSQDIRPFIISHPIPPLADESEAQFPALLLYLLHMFAKFILAQFISEAGKDDGKILQEIGLIAASIFADPVYTWNGIPLVDLMLAKYHRVCPVLFGIYGREDTVRGRERLGWLSVDGKSRSTNDHHQRMLGLSSGFAALTLRAFKNHPAIPMSAYWRAVAVVVDTPPADLTTTHMVVLKGLLRDYAAKFIEFYGGTALALLRASVIEVPKRAPPAATEGANLLKVLPDLWKRGLFLTVE